MIIRGQVDQSVKIEQTSRDTVLAFSDDIQRAIRIPARVKREVLAGLKARGKRAPTTQLMVFAAGLFLLLRDIAQNLGTVTIDQEYPGREADIRGMLLRFMQERAGLTINKEVIVFGQVGKKSKAHERAWRVYRGEIVPDHVVTTAELLEVL